MRSLDGPVFVLVMRFGETFGDEWVWELSDSSLQIRSMTGYAWVVPFVNSDYRQNSGIENFDLRRRLIDVLVIHTCIMSEEMNVFVGDGCANVDPLVPDLWWDHKCKCHDAYR